jgi:hypothetical protein
MTAGLSSRNFVDGIAGIQAEAPAKDDRSRMLAA